MGVSLACSKAITVASENVQRASIQAEKVIKRNEKTCPFFIVNKALGIITCARQELSEELLHTCMACSILSSFIGLS